MRSTPPEDSWHKAYCIFFLQVWFGCTHYLQSCIRLETYDMNVRSVIIERIHSVWSAYALAVGTAVSSLDKLLRLHVR